MTKPGHDRWGTASTVSDRDGRLPLLYIVAFALFILGLSCLTGPDGGARQRVAARRHARGGASRRSHGRHTWLLILAGSWSARRRLPARRVQMTAMPQMVALFNGVGGGAVALIAGRSSAPRRRSPASR